MKQDEEKSDFVDAEDEEVSLHEESDGWIVFGIGEKGGTKLWGLNRTCAVKVLLDVACAILQSGLAPLTVFDVMGYELDIEPHELKINLKRIISLDLKQTHIRFMRPSKKEPKKYRDCGSLGNLVKMIV